MRQARRQGHPHRRTRHPAREEAQAAWTCSSTPGRSKASCRKACSRPNSAGARMKSGCRQREGRTQAGCGAAIYLMQPGADTRVRTWCPTRGAQYGFLVTHNEAISIADYFTVRDEAAQGRLPADLPLRLSSRPTTPCSRWHEMFGRAGKRAGEASHPRRKRDRRRHRRTRRAALRPRQQRLLVRLAAFHRGDAQARALSERHRSAGDLAVLAGMVWALENPNAGIVEADEMDFRRCLEVQIALSRPGQGLSTPTGRRSNRSSPACSPEEDIDTKSDPWQFRNSGSFERRSGAFRSWSNLPCNGLRGAYVASLRALVTAAEQDHDLRPASAKINPVSRTEMDP
jgi:hypothetical protein